MAYELRALACGPALARRAAARLELRAGRLTDDLWLVPLPGRVDRDARLESTAGDPMLCLTPLVEAVAVELSASGAVAYIEAEFFAGAGTQAAAVWEGGSAVVGPITWEHRSLAFRGDAPDRPINAALRRCGVVAGTHADEFDTVGLGRHRCTEDWLGGDVPKPEDLRT